MTKFVSLLPTTNYNIMRDAGVYTQLWKKYLPVIRLLLKKTADTDQKLQIYKHEFASTGAKNKLGYIFNLEIVNGKAINKSAAIAVRIALSARLNLCLLSPYLMMLSRNWSHQTNASLLSIGSPFSLVAISVQI